MRTDLAPSLGVVTTAPTSLDDALRLVRTDHDAWTVLISPHRSHAENRRLMYQARAAEEETLVAFHITELSPLGVSVLEEMAQPLKRVLPARLLLPALAVLESHIRCLTVTSSVIDMNEPKVPLWLHARSWIPGGSYIAERGHKARGFRQKKPEKALEHFDSAPAGHIAIAAESGDKKRRGERVNGTLNKLIEHLAPEEVILRENSEPEWWGSKHAAQLVLAPTNLSFVPREASTALPSAEDLPAQVLTTDPHVAIEAPAEGRQGTLDEEDNR